ncbi:IPT/TIG domain-containing protein [Fibrella sp. WM1]|uniref:IPT/TIG domain-containing protein n=1 Tax=Fibrella musci TaxID=3242485 RepID=UPI003520AF7E
MEKGVRFAVQGLCLLVMMVAALAGCKVNEFPPELWSVNPSQYEIGRSVELKGAQFGAEPIVTFGQGATAVQASIQSRSDQALTVVVPRIATGPTQVQVANSQGMTPPLSFTVVQPRPVLTALSPENTPPGGVMKVTGDNIDRVTSIRFDTTRAASFTVVSPNEVLVTISPTLPKGQYIFHFATEGGEFGTPYLVAGTPVITGFTPKRGRAGQEIVITGRYLADGQVFVNRGLADPATVRGTDTEIRAIIPPDATTGRVSVRTFNQLTGISADSIYLASTPVIQAGPTPAEGIVGDKVVLTGLNYRDVSEVKFGTVTAPFRILSDTQLEVTVPARTEAGNVPVTISGIGGSTTSNQPFFYIQAPANIAFTPLRRAKNKQVTITGQNLSRIQSITLNGKPVSIHSAVEGVEVTFFVSPTDASGLITVTNRAGTATSTRSLTVIQSPTVTDYPRRIAAGARMVLKGTWLRDAVVQFSGAASPALIDGKNEDNELWIRVPDDAQTGSFQLITDSPDVFSSEQVTIIRPVPNIAFTPTAGKVGDEITVTGTFFEDVTDVRFNGGASLPATFRREFNSLKVTVPANAVTGTICLTNPAGIACSAGTFTVLRLPSGLSFSPKKGLAGTEVTISGQNLADVTEVRFSEGKSQPAVFRRVGATIIATVPADAVDGSICLTNAAGTICTGEFYDVLLPISNVAVATTTAKVGTEVIITGTNVLTVSEVRFSNGRSSAAKFRGVGATLAVTVPADATSGPICLTNEAGTVCTKETVTIEK